MKTFTIKNVPIIEAGKWHQGNTEITEADLDDMVENYQATKARLKPWIYLGSHSSKKEMEKSAIGVPFFGALENIRRVGKALVADLSELPQKVYDLIAAGAYRRPSIELWRTWKDTVTDSVRKNVLSGVALLGADQPASNTLPLKIGTLDDVAALYASGGDDVSKLFLDIAAVINFTEFEIEEMGADDPPKPEVNNEPEGGDNMGEIEVLKGQIENLQKKIDNAEKANADLVESYTEENKKLKDELDAKVKAENDTALKIRETKIEEFLESVVKDGKLLPAEKMIYAKSLRDEKDLDGAIGDLKKLFAEKGKVVQLDDENGDEGEHFSEETAELRKERERGKLAGDLAVMGYIGQVPENELAEMSESFAERKPGDRAAGLELCRESLAKDLRKHMKK
jgi:hypothetical protein